MAISSVAELKKWLLDEQAETKRKIEYWTAQRLSKDLTRSKDLPRNARDNRVKQKYNEELIHFCAQLLILDSFIGKINSFEAGLKERIKSLEKGIKYGSSLDGHIYRQVIKELHRVLEGTVAGRGLKK